MRWSDDYYLANGGGCRRIPLDIDGTIIDGSSVDLALMTKCSAPGEHPHPPTGKLVGAERAVQRVSQREPLVLDYATLRSK